MKFFIEFYLTCVEMVDKETDWHSKVIRLIGTPCQKCRYFVGACDVDLRNRLH
jgi:hypothetical protein